MRQPDHLLAEASNNSANGFSIIKHSAPREVGRHRIDLDPIKCKIVRP